MLPIVAAHAAQRLTQAPSQLLPILVRSGGAFYGLATSGGNPCVTGISLPDDGVGYVGCGAILRIDASGTSSVAHLFSPEEGARPFALRAGKDGTLLGVTMIGGAHGRGTSFRFDPAKKKLTVLQSLTSEASAPGVDVYLQSAAALENGTVVFEQPPQIVSLEAGKAPRDLYRFPGGSVLAPFALDGGEHVVLTVKAPDACDAALVSLASDGMLASLSEANKTGSADCAKINPSDPVAVHLASNGSFIANDEHRIYVAQPGKPFDEALTLAPSAEQGAAGMRAGNAVLGPGGAIFVGATEGDTCGGVARFGTGSSGLQLIGGFDSKTTCLHGTDGWMAIEPAKSGIIGVFGDENVGGGSVFRIVTPNTAKVLKHFPTAPALDDVSFEPQFAPAIDDSQRLVGSWSARPLFDLPQFSVDPSAIVITMRNTSVAGAQPVRLMPISHAVVDETHVQMTMEEIASIEVHFELPTLVPGRYEIVVDGPPSVPSAGHPPALVRNAHFVTYWLVTPRDLKRDNIDPDLSSVSATLSNKSVTFANDGTMNCWGAYQTDAVRKGEKATFDNVARRREAAVTGYGLLNLLQPGPGDFAVTHGSFYSLAPLQLFLKTGDTCSLERDFATKDDLLRYIEPSGTAPQ